MATRRVKNEANAKDVMKVIRVCYRSLAFATFNMPEFEKVVQNHIEFIRQVLQLARKLNEKLLEAAGFLVFPDQQATVTLFAAQICRAVSMCRQKKGKVTTGSRQLPEVLAVIKLLEGEPSPVSAEKLAKRSASPAPGPHVSASSSSLELSPGKILATYGLKAQKKNVQPEVPVEVLSSQEVTDSPAREPTAAKAAATSSPLSCSQATIYLDSTRKALVRVISGKVEVIS